MNATPPKASTEYSRAPGRFSGGFAIPSGILAAGLLGALLLVVSEFATLFDVRTQSSRAAVQSVTTGSHHAYAMTPIALLAALLTVGVWHAHSRPALLALGVLGVIALLISLLGDLPDAHASGLLPGSGGRYVTAAARPGAGFYMETLGAMLLLITCVGGFLLLIPPGHSDVGDADRGHGSGRLREAWRLR